jgi:DNA polymerase (family X)
MRFEVPFSQMQQYLSLRLTSIPTAGISTASKIGIALEEITLKNLTNDQIADVLDRIADMLEIQNANPFRVRAYREGADTIRDRDEAIADLVRHGQLNEVKALPNIGDGIASVIKEYVQSGQSNLLQELESKSEPETVFMQVPGIGRELAGRIVNEIHIETLPELEVAAHDGRLASVRGFGQRRVEGVRKALAGMLSLSARSKQQDRAAQAQTQKGNDQLPSISLLLEIDAEYRRRAEADDLLKIAPRRFNPDNKEWLPVMHTKRQGWLFTVLFSNTAQAHQLGKTHDWVVIYYERKNKEQQNTIVTELRGPLKGNRVVRGRDAEMHAYYSAQAS